jgi:hypothetical protein
MVLKKLSLEAASWPIFIVLKKTSKMQKNRINLQFPNSNCFETIPSSNENKLMVEVKFPYSYLEFKSPPFPNRLSYNAAISRQNGMRKASRTQTDGHTAATAGYSLFSKWRPPMLVTRYGQ